MPIRNERRDAAEHRRLILKTAQTLFDEHGVDNVSMHQIAKSAGIGQGTLYRRYTHKGDLCLDLMKESFISFQQTITDYLQNAEGCPIRERMETILRTLVEFVDKKTLCLGVIQRPTQKCEEGPAMYFHSPPYLFIHGTICNLLEEALLRGECIRIDPVYTAHAILCSVAPDLFLFLRRERGYNPEQIMESIRMLYLDSVFSPTPAE